MSFFHNNALAGASGQGGAAGAYEIERSVRFNAADSAYLSRTPSSAGNRKTWTWSGWIKRTVLGSYQTLFGTDGSVGAYTVFQFTPSDTLSIYSNSASLYFITSAVFRDTSAWMHLLIAVDTTAATSTDRFKFYVNGTQVTAFSTQTYPTQNLDTFVNSTVLHTLGRFNASYYFNGYLADIHLIDGQALAPTDFGEFDTNGVWQPKAYSGTYGTNGFHLDFSDNSTAAALGTDTSGNSNTWTVNNISVAAGAGNDSLVDSPTNYGSDTGAGGQVRGNYATFSPLAVSSQGQATLVNGNLDVSGSGTSYTGCVTGLALSSGKWYWEYTTTAVGSVNGTGIIDTSQLRSANGSTYGYAAASRCWYRNNLGQITNNSGAPVTSLATFTNNDVVNIAVDFDAGKLWFGKNGTWDGSGNPATGANASITFTPGGNSYYALAQGYGSWSGVLNAGARAFAYTAPSGFKALCTQNLPTPTIADGSTAMDVALYTGTGSALTPTSSLGFSPDLVWIKSRSAATDHALYDTVRGATIDLVSNSTAAETTQTQGLTAFNSNGFSVGTLAKVNTNAATYAAWAFDAGSSTVTNTAGTISSQVRANASAGFSIVTFTYPSSGSFTVGHGLGVTPSLIIAKHRNRSQGWLVYHSSATSKDQYLILNATDAVGSATDVWGANAPTSTVFGNTTGVSGISGDQELAYCFAPVAGYSAFGSYTGNGSADGPFVFTGMRPRWVMVKNASSAGNWTINDASRDPYNVSDTRLWANLSSAEGASANYYIDFLSNGFKLRTNAADTNTSAATYVYAAFAEHPFSLARAR